MQEHHMMTACQEHTSPLANRYKARYKGAFRQPEKVNSFNALAWY
jgi:hypothetical protein